MLLNSQGHEFVVFFFAVSGCTYLFCRLCASNCFRTTMENVYTYFATLSPSERCGRQDTKGLLISALPERSYCSLFVCVSRRIIHYFSASGCWYKRSAQFHFAFCRVGDFKSLKVPSQHLVRNDRLGRTFTGYRFGTSQKCFFISHALVRVGGLANKVILCLESPILL